MNAAGTPRNLKPAKQTWNLKGGTSIYVPRELATAVLEYARQLDADIAVNDLESGKRFDSLDAGIEFYKEEEGLTELPDNPETDALLETIADALAPVAEENFNDWIAKQEGYEIESYVLDENSGELLQKQPLQQPETSTLATKQQAKRNRRLNQAKKSGALSGKGFAISTQKSEIEEKKLLYKNAEILFAKENAKLRKRYADLMQEVLLTCTPGKLQLFEDVTKVCNDFLGSTLKYTTSESGWEAYLNSKTYYRDFVEGKIPASKTAGGINDQFLSLIFEGLECWIDCYLTVRLG